MLIEFGLIIVELLVGVVYPLLKTMGVSQQNSEEGPFRTWCMYWVVFGALQWLSTVFTSTLFAFLKVAVVGFMVIPQLNGAGLLYELVQNSLLPQVQGLWQQIQGLWQQIQGHFKTE